MRSTCSAPSPVSVPAPRSAWALRPERLWTWLLLFLVVAGILFFRQPAAIRHPGFYAEDGAIYFKQGYEQGAFSLLLRSHAGYLQVVPRAVAALGSLFPLQLVPAAYAVASLVLAAAVSTFFYSARFRPVIAGDATRIGVILLFLLMPNSDSLMRLAYLPWYMLWFITLVTLMELPRGSWQRGVLFGAVTLAVWSTPVAIVCLPVIFLRVRRAADRGERIWWMALMLCVIAYALTSDRGVVWAALDQPGLAQSIIHAIGYRVFCYFFLGSALARPLPATGWEMVTRFSLLLVGACALAAVVVAGKKLRESKDGAWASLVVLYLILALPTLFVLRAEWVPDFLGFHEERTWLWHQRYFFCSTLLLCVLAGMVYEKVIRDRLFSSLPRRVIAGGLLLCWISLHTPTFVLWDWHVAPSWKHFAREIQAAETRVNQTGRQEIVHIPNVEDVWAFDLIVEKNMRGGTTR